MQWSSEMTLLIYIVTSLKWLLWFAFGEYKLCSHLDIWEVTFDFYYFIHKNILYFNISVCFCLLWFPKIKPLLTLFSDCIYAVTLLPYSQLFEKLISHKKKNVFKFIYRLRCLKLPNVCHIFLNTLSAQCKNNTLYV